MGEALHKSVPGMRKGTMPAVENCRRIVFCDFDGTITVEETFVGMLKRFAQVPYEEIEKRMLSREITLKEGVTRLVESIPSEHYAQVLEYIRHKELRPGLPELLSFLQDEHVPFVVISGGLIGPVLTRLNPLLQEVHAVHAADVNTEGKTLRVHSDFVGETELVAKARVMALYSYDEAVSIGDGISDLNMALHSSLVFARDNLKKYLDASNKLYNPWDDFYDVRRTLAQRWQVCIPG